MKTEKIRSKCKKKVEERKFFLVLLLPKELIQATAPTSRMGGIPSEFVGALVAFDAAVRDHMTLRRVHFVKTDRHVS